MSKHAKKPFETEVNWAAEVNSLYVICWWSFNEQLNADVVEQTNQRHSQQRSDMMSYSNSIAPDMASIVKNNWDSEAITIWWNNYP